MTVTKDKKYLLRNLHSLIKKDNIQDFIELTSIYPNIIKYKNSKNENLLFYSLLNKSNKISSYLIALNPSLLTERNSSGRNVVQSSVMRDGDIQFFTEIASNLSEETLKNIYSNVDNQGLNLLMLSAIHCNTDKIIDIFKKCPNIMDIQYQENHVGANVAHFISTYQSDRKTSHISKLLKFIDKQLFLRKSNLSITPIMLASETMNKDSFQEIIKHSFKNMDEYSVKDFCEISNRISYSVIEYSLFNKDPSLYSSIQSSYTNPSFKVAMLPHLINKLAHVDSIEHAENFLHYLDKHLVDNLKDQPFAYFSLFHEALNNKCSSLISLIINKRPDIIQHFTKHLNNFNPLNYSFKDIAWHNMPGDLFGEFFIKAFNSENTCYYQNYFLMIRSITQNSTNSLGVLSSFINNHSKFVSRISDLPNKKDLFSIHLQDVFNFKKEHIKFCIENSDILNFFKKNGYQNILGLAAYTRNISESSNLLTLNEPVVISYLNESIKNKSHLFSLNSDITSQSYMNPTYNYWSLLDDDIMPYTKKLLTTDFYLDGLQYSYNKKAFNYLIDKNMIIPFLLNIGNFDFSKELKHLGNFFQDIDSFNLFFTSLKKELETNLNQHSQEISLQSLLYLISSSQTLPKEEMLLSITKVCNLYEKLGYTHINQDEQYSLKNFLKESLKNVEKEIKNPKILISFSESLKNFELGRLLPPLQNSIIEQHLVKLYLQHYKTINDNNSTFTLSSSLKTDDYLATTPTYKVDINKDYLNALGVKEGDLKQEHFIILLDYISTQTEPLFNTISSGFLKNCSYTLHFLFFHEFSMASPLAHATFMTESISENIFQEISQQNDLNKFISFYALAKANGVLPAISNNNHFIQKLEPTNLEHLLILSDLKPEILSEPSVKKYWEKQISLIDSNTPCKIFDPKIFSLLYLFPEPCFTNIHLQNYMLKFLNTNEGQTNNLIFFKSFNYYRDFFEKFLHKNDNHPAMKSFISQLDEDIFSNYEMIVQIEDSVMRASLDSNKVNTSNTHNKSLKF